MRRPVSAPERPLRPSRPLMRPLAVAAVLGAATGYLAAVDPNRPGHYPGCPFRALFGVYCPGCGGLRAVHDLTHGDVPAALSSNLLVTLAIPVVVVLWVRWFRRRARPGTDRRVTHPTGTRLAGTHFTGTGPTAPGTSSSSTKTLLTGDAKGRLRAGVRPWGPVAVVLGLILFGVLRNIPGWEFLAP
ncbi:DUF2752 domain-containing protein [Kineosporia mesophila]|uniref:DUF2752 domain-containing protein n=1 Tax=Kineosporia mesophila TaxID=566012 RepID=UPI001E47CDEE|nr:DUF2752 domain-containing protein [Kineosporia mesophila]